MMRVPKYNPVIFAAFFVTAIAAMTPAAIQAQSIDYRFGANSTYSYSAGFAPTILFDLSGTFTLNRNLGSATITNAIFELSTSDTIPFTNPLHTAEGLAEFLENDNFLAFIPSVDGQAYFGTAAAPFSSTFPPSNNAYSIFVDDSSSSRLLTFSGVGNPSGISPFVDGDQFVFSATATAVPEPTGLPACLLLAMTVLGRRGRRTT